MGPLGVCEKLDLGREGPHFHTELEELGAVGYELFSPGVCEKFDFSRGDPRFCEALEVGLI